MEDENTQHGHIIEFRRDIPVADLSQGGSKLCDGVPCGFSDAATNSKDAHERAAAKRKLLTAIVLCVIFMTVEVIGGIKSNSLAILTDAAHLLSDVASFGISLFSLWAASWEATPRQSYGFFRIEILGTLVSIQLIWLVTGIIVYEAVYRLINGTTAVQGSLMFLVAGFGVIVNLIMALMLGHDHGHGHGHGGHDHGHGHGHGGHDHSHGHHGHDDVHGHGGHDHVHGHDHGSTISRHDSGHSEHEDHINEPLIKKAEGKKRNINVHGAYLHVIGDLIQSVGVMIGGAIIWYKPSWKIVDLICTLIFSIVVLKTTINLLRNILEVLMESTPREIDATSLEEGLRAMDEVTAVHELHIWAITVGKILLACHVKITPDADADKVLEKVVDYIKRVYNISHVTVQIER